MPCAQKRHQCGDKKPTAVWKVSPFDSCRCEEPLEGVLSLESGGVAIR